VKCFLKSKKGMTLIEVILALSLLAIFTLPLTIGFMNSLLISRKIEVENHVNAVTSIIKERVQDALIDENIDLPYVSGGTFNIIDFISSNIVGDGGESDPIEVEYSSDDGEKNNYKFFYRLSYHHDSCYDEEYETVYHVIVSVYLVNRDFKGTLQEAITQNKYKSVNIFKVGADVRKKLHAHSEEPGEEP